MVRFLIFFLKFESLFGNVGSCLDHAGDLSNGLANMTLANGGGGRSLVNGHPHVNYF